MNATDKLSAAPQTPNGADPAVENHGGGAAPSRFSGRLREPRVPVTVGAVIVGVGVWMWWIADSGTKGAELGAGLIATGVLGFLLLWVERALAARTDDIGRAVGRAAAPPPAVDERSDLPSMEPASSDQVTNEPHRPIPTGERPRRFTAELIKWGDDTSRIDAKVFALRVRADGEYFQFFTGIVAGLDLRLTPTSITVNRLQRALIDQTASLARSVIERGGAPLENPDQAIEVHPDISEAARAALHAPDVAYEVGEQVAEWFA